MWDQPIENRWREKSARHITFQHVHEQHKDTRRLAQHAHGVRRADVAAADTADINALRLRHEKAKWNRAEQIRGERDQDVTQNWHGGNLTVAGWKLKVES